jgi:soluble cytochrome b562
MGRAIRDYSRGFSVFSTRRNKADRQQALAKSAAIRQRVQSKVNVKLSSKSSESVVNADFMSGFKRLPDNLAEHYPTLHRSHKSQNHRPISPSYTLRSEQSTSGVTIRPFWAEPAAVIRFTRMGSAPFDRLPRHSSENFRSRSDQMGVKAVRSFIRWLLYRDATAYLSYRRACQGCDRAAEREKRWYGDPFGKR